MNVCDMALLKNIFRKCINLIKHLKNFDMPLKVTLLQNVNQYHAYFNILLY